MVRRGARINRERRSKYVFSLQRLSVKIFFHNWSLPASKSIERKITTSRKLHFSTRNVVQISAFHYVFKPFSFHSKQGGARLPSSVSGGTAVKTNGEALE